MDLNKEPSRSPRWIMWASILLALFPLAVLLYKLPQYVLDFPYWDDLVLAPFLEKAYAGQLTMAELWTQHNEHRPFFPRLIMIGLALLTQWDVRWTIGVSVLLGIGIFVLLALLAHRTAGRRSMAAWAAAPALALFVFSWAQMENWIWSLEVTVFVCKIAVVGGIFLLYRSRPNPLAIVLAMFCGVVATYSFANGILYWIAALPALMLAPYASRHERAMWCIGWLFMGAAAIGAYFWNYEKPAVSPPLLAFLGAPHEYLGFILLYLGSPVVAIFSTPPWHGGPPHPIGPGHFVPGILGVLAALLVVLRLRGLPWEGWTRVAPWLSLIAFAVGSALVSGLGRVGLGIYQGLNSRYMTTNLLFWCGLIGCIAVLTHYLPKRAPQSEKSLRLRWALGGLVLVAATLLTAQQQAPWEENATWKRLGWRALQGGFDAPLFMADLCWDVKEMETVFLPFLRKNELAGMTENPLPDPALAEDFLSEGIKLLRGGLLRPALVYADAALHFNPEHEQAPAFRRDVLLAIEAAKTEQK